MKSPRAFTLIELLAAVCITGVLAALLVPIINSSLRNAKTSACVSNLRQIGFAALSYAADNGNRLPVNIKYATPAEGVVSGRWVDFLIPYLGKQSGSGYVEKVFHCPLAPVNQYISGGSNATLGLYIVSDRMNGNDWPANPITISGVTYPYAGQTFPNGVPLHIVQHPTEVVLVGEAPIKGTPGGPNMDILNYYPKTARGAAANHRPDQDPRNGDGRANYLFVDGHAETREQWPGRAAFEVR